MLPSWKLALAADRKSKATIEAYILGAQLYLRWCAEGGHPAVLERQQVRTWIAELLAAGAAPATARTRQAAVKRYSAWLEEEGETDTDPLLGLRPPKLDVPVTESLTDNECAALVKACQGKEFIDRRDEAIARLDTGPRQPHARGLYESEGYVPIANFNGNPVATFFGDKRLSG